MAMFPVFTVYVTSLYDRGTEQPSTPSGTDIAQSSNKPKSI